jgi:ribosomal protein S18 acetylase RimI-like enzyme
MRIELDQPFLVNEYPGGIVERWFERDQHAHAVYEAHQEAFADHWGFERSSYEEWAHFLLDAPNVDTTMWKIAWDEARSEIAGLCLNGPYGEGDPQMAWTRVLGVRRPYRKQGLGEALLKHSFGLFQARGYRRAGLGVDASSLTNAVALYERAGMHVHKRTFAYQKSLRRQAPEASA